MLRRLIPATASGMWMIRIPTLIAIRVRAGSLRLAQWMIRRMILRMRRVRRLHALRVERPTRIHASRAVRPLRRGRLHANHHERRQ